MSGKPPSGLKSTVSWKQPATYTLVSNTATLLARSSLLEPQVLVHSQVPSAANLLRKASRLPFDLWEFVADPGSKSTVL